MDRAEFEKQILRLWTLTRVPLTRPHVQILTGASRAEVERYANDLVGTGVLELDSDASGEVLLTVPGAARSLHGPRTVEEAEKLARLEREVHAAVPAERALVAPRADVWTRGSGAPGAGRKSVLASGALSFFFGPLGWLYAAPLREALPAIGLYMLACALLPHALLAYLLGGAHALTALIGVGYALRHNQTGRRTPLFTAPGAPLPPGRDNK